VSIHHDIGFTRGPTPKVSRTRLHTFGRHDGVTPTGRPGRVRRNRLCARRRPRPAVAGPGGVRVMHRPPNFGAYRTCTQHVSHDDGLCVSGSLSQWRGAGSASAFPSVGCCSHHVLTTDARRSSQTGSLVCVRPRGIEMRQVRSFPQSEPLATAPWVFKLPWGRLRLNTLDDAGSVANHTRKWF
jgi:hypothetical protein